MKSSDEENSGNVLITINLNVDVVNSLKIQKKKIYKNVSLWWLVDRVLCS